MKKAVFMDDLGIQLLASSPERTECLLAIEERHFNTMGMVHGGVLFSLADTAMGLHVCHLIAESEACATVDARISFLKPVVGGVMRCTAVVVSRGRTIAHLEAEIFNEGRLVAKSQSVIAIRERRQDRKEEQ